MTESDNPLKERFAIIPLLDIEIDIGATGWVGITPDAPEGLRTDVTAAVIATRLGNKSIDYTRKKYKDIFIETPDRDEVPRDLCRHHLYRYNEFYRTIEVRNEAPIGIFAFDLAMIRSRTSIELLLTTARQGFLIEPCLIARALLEQFAYSSEVFDKTENTNIFNTRPQALISKLNSINPNAGRAYGYLSRLAHYDPKMHYEFIGDKTGSSVTQRSWRFKIISMAWLFFIIQMKFTIFAKFYGSHENFHVLDKLSGTALKLLKIIS